MEPTVYDVLTWLLGVVQARLVADGSAPISTAYPAAGIVAWDDCCGQLTVAPERVYRAKSFPDEATGLEQCWGGWLTVDVVVLLVRCVSGPNDNGDPPSAATLAAEYAAFLADAQSVWAAVAGATMPDDWERAGLAQTFTGAEGGCVAVETRVKIGIDSDGF